MLKIKVYGSTSNSKVAFLFSGVGLPLRHLEFPGLPIWSLRRAGYAVVAYEYPWKIAYHGELYAQTLQSVYEDAQKKINSLADKSEIVAVGISFGSLCATRLATSYKKVKSLVLIVPYADPRLNMKDYISTKKYTAKDVSYFKKTTKDYQKFNRFIAKFAPLELAHHTKHLRVLLVIGRRDKFFIYKFAKKLRDELRKYAGAFRCFEPNLGHYWGATLYNTQSWRWLKWLDYKISD